MQVLNFFLTILSSISITFAADISVSCETVPSASLESTPYSVATKNAVANGESVVAILNYYRSVTYVSNCDNTTPTTTPVPTVTEILY
ncbi:hypothetical protein KAFR_0F03580 [Kazachstania africana CBS 2517]|uniref:Uncharacterized protein n=1 Tax=Kazachstania africana (strain ATCC 22294 / BCRC 22015 / CBS 2517 / CECT 1963 / NBRC 1671 / NRRL Y-8276) TaxID=1071382 RepID=H2AX54_KAZAF|nr:hypothetical protein KAFR_0F03580 [Kazachstania africana CBS 2517]CCF58954.1 hypothetical protein KAFR_0F03580 [Kazachstania africana CBS 2517]